MLSAFEKQLIQKALEENAENKTNTAKQLGISLRSLYYKLEKYRLAKISMVCVKFYSQGQMSGKK
ncbi:helix-turn-helix domain-containing protein [Heyndrickxia coagulans]|uniref:DNA binding HTH domain-containing protein n=1 Tax=Heyndrickxia coagulans TaxID=1398 RepID=A0A150KCN3_HEYCO|nr:helix-turn-helix domain-containing protein [Heyndrickxia coagulans]KYC67250.1 hypothetical protein B4099_3072 [Heyndrickxia coagulans]